MTENKERDLPMYILKGKVIRGKGIGKLVGMPTANLEIKDEINLPVNGVYAVKIIYDSSVYYGVTNVGMRPTIDDDSRISVETHIFNFNRNIYGENVEIQFFKRLRDTIKFSDLATLLEQIRKDSIEASEYFEIKAGRYPLCMEMEKHRVRIDNHEVYLSSKEFDVLYMLYSNPDIVFTKEEIYENIWCEPANGSIHAVENTVFQIRKKLKTYSGKRDYIKTVVGHGYKFCR